MFSRPSGEPRTGSRSRPGSRRLAFLLVSSLVLSFVVGLSLIVAACRPSAHEPSEAERRVEEHRIEDLLDQADEARDAGDPGAAERAVAFVLEALEIARREGDPAWTAAILYHLGGIHRHFDEMAPARDAYAEALALFETLGDRGNAASAHNNLGRVQFALGEVDEAMASWRRALAIERDLGDREGEAATLSNLALQYRYRGEVQEALERYDESLALLIDLGKSRDQVRVLNNRGRLYRMVGDEEQALADLRRALEIARRIENREEEARVLTGLGQVLEQRGDLSEAVEKLEASLELRREVGDERGRAVTLAALAGVHERLGDSRRAEALHREALGIFRHVQAPRSVAVTLVALARLANADGRREEAGRSLHEALEAFRRLRDPHGEIRALLESSAVERASGRDREALEQVDHALDRVETVRQRARSPHLRAAYLASRQDAFDTSVDLLMDLHHREPGAGYDLRALAANERSRARSLLDRLATESARGAEATGALAERIDLLEQQRLALLDRPLEGERRVVLETVEARLDELLREHRAAAVLAGSKALEAEPLGAEEIPTLLDRGTLLVVYRLGPERSHLWVVGEEGLESASLPARAEIEGAARRAYETAQRGHLRLHRSTATEALRNLGEILLAPIADRVKGAERLVVVADGALHYVPFAALPVPGSDEGEDGGENEPIIARHEIVQLPSISTLARLRRRDRERAIGSGSERSEPRGVVAVIADPVFSSSDPRLRGLGVEETRLPDGSDLAPLPHSRAEAEAITALVEPEGVLRALGFDATRSAVLDPALGDYRFVHLATHGVLDTERPELTRLVFSRFAPDGRRLDAALYAHEIHSLPYKLSADLVTLSACGTALGREMRGEGLVGLTQGFFDAGADRVLVSLWRIDDRATAELMTRFYRLLLVEGETPAAALRRAQLSMRDETGWRAPYYWAGFVLQGDWLGPD